VGDDEMTSVLPPKHSARRRGALALRHLVLLGFAGFFIIPLVWLVLAPTKTDYDLITRSPLALGNLHNVQIAWQNLNAFGNHIYWRWMENSLIYSLTATALVLVTVIPAGYGLAIGSFRGRKLILTLTLVAIVMPAASLVLPIFLELNAMGLIGNALSIILPFAFFPFGVYLAYIYYATALPPGLLDAARVDGCGELQTFVRVALPLATPVVALVFFFSFVADWNNFFLPYAILPDQKQFPVQVGLSDIFTSSRPAVALATLIAALPVAIVFVASQRALVRGVVDGATKG
jgi:multiple sugar transport system permease protein